MQRLKGEINKRRRKNAINGAALRQLVVVSPLAWRQLKMGMFSRQQQQQFILALAEQRGIFRRLFKLPDPQAQVKALGGALLRHPGGNAKQSYVGLDDNAWLKGCRAHIDVL